MPATTTPGPGDAPATSAVPLDLDHLRRQCLDDEALMRELLALFRIEAPALAARLTEESPSAGAEIAHRLRGAALAVGAFAVARAAEILAGPGGRDGAPIVEMSQAIENLARAVAQAVAAIDRLTP
ncbi:Hpt protein [Roseiarcus fermentans]|uniref:Hpt protein n=1 Tax=Roseiarcus fermentans TaxID=1473586 RepID=A0A366F6R3_9HYPH|nr:Hpt domain-containing protein [Roseiarcus fermentans]RBP09660.1 Hpt protein [Roseiarcus fermentans]